MSRNSHSNETATEEKGKSEDGNNNPKKQRAKKITQTIETKVESLNATRLENEHFVDPMFHKMSKAFDEGGAKGMLMNNIVCPLLNLYLSLLL